MLPNYNRVYMDYFTLNESESALDPVISVPLNTKSEDEIEALLLTEFKNIGIIDKTICPDIDSYVDHIMKYCVDRDLYPDFISSKIVDDKRNEKTGEVESGYMFIIVEFIYIKMDGKEDTISVGIRIDDDGNTYSLSLYFY